MGAQEDADFPPFWPHGRRSGRRDSHGRICVLEKVWFLLGQEYEKREFSEETGACRNFIYTQRVIPTGTRQKDVVKRWRVSVGSWGEKHRLVN